MMLKLLTPAAITLFNIAMVAGQQNSQTVDLAGIISEAAGIASAFGTPTPASSTSSPTTSTSSTTSSASSSASTTLSSSSTPSSTAASSTASSASSSASASATGDPDAGGITPQARNIIIAVSVVGAVLILGLLIGLALCCCLRRRRKHRRLANTETKEIGPNEWIHGREVGRNDWTHGDTSHHGYVSDHSDIDRQPRIPEVAQHDSAPLMAEHLEEPAAAPAVHPAYRTHSWDGKNVNERNPFTPNPPITRKPLPHGYDNRKSHPFMAAGAGAAVGAAAMHHHENKKQQERDSGNSQSASSAYTSHSGPLLDEGDHGRDFRDPNRPPTPFGLNAFASSPNKRSSRSGAIEPSLAAHDQRRSNEYTIDHPTEAQRRSLSEREMTPTAANPIVPERSPKRSSFGNRGQAINPDSNPRTAYHDPTRNGNETDTSNESWQSAEATHTPAPPPPLQSHPTSPPYWDDGNPYYPEPSHHHSGGDHDAFTNVPLMAPPNAAWTGQGQGHSNSNDDGSSWRRSYEPFRRYGADGSPRRSVGADGKPRRLRFSDLSPEEYHYNYEPMHNVGQAL